MEKLEKIVTKIAHEDDSADLKVEPKVFISSSRLWNLMILFLGEYLGKWLLIVVKRSMPVSALKTY